MTELFYFDKKTFNALPPAERSKYQALLRNVIIPSGRPFFLGDDYLPNRELEGFCNYIPGPKRPSKNTWKSYASQIAVFLRFMQAQGKSWLQATKSDLELYFTVRTTGEFQSTRKIKGRSWNVAKAAIVHLYEYAVDEELIVKPPFKYRKHKTFGGNVVESADLGAKSTPEPINFISVTNYKTLWRPLIADGENSQRNLALVDTLIASGLRITEALNIEIHQVPDPDDQRFAGRKSIVLRVVGKGKKPRNVLIPKRIVRAIRFYMEEERAAVLQRVVARKGKVHGKQSTMKQSTMKQSTKKQPTKVFLARTGKPLSSRVVETLFVVLSKKTGIKLTPHGCRHTYAIYQLEAMIKRMASNLKMLRESGADAYRQILNDPLRELQRLLGHSSITSTYIYLDFLEESEALVDESLNEWTSWENENGR